MTVARGVDAPLAASGTIAATSCAPAAMPRGCSLLHRADPVVLGRARQGLQVAEWMARSEFGRLARMSTRVPIFRRIPATPKDTPIEGAPASARRGPWQPV
jgi:hypothetical protein